MIILQAFTERCEFDPLLSYQTSALSGGLTGIYIFKTAGVSHPLEQGVQFILDSLLSCLFQRPPNEQSSLSYHYS